MVYSIVVWEYKLVQSVLVMTVLELIEKGKFGGQTSLAKLCPHFAYQEPVNDDMYWSHSWIKINHVVQEL